MAGRAVPGHVSCLSLLILLPVGLTVLAAARIAWENDAWPIRVFAIAYAALGVVLMVRRVHGVMQERSGVR
jgi:uncharacterized membrane protein